MPRFDENFERIRVDSRGLGGSAIDVAAGTNVTDLVGISQFDFGAATIYVDPTSPPTVPPLPTATPVSAAATTEFTVASANLERFFDTVDDPTTSDPVLTNTAYQMRLGKASKYIRNIMRNPDIVGVAEVENFTTLQALATRIDSDAMARH